MRSLQRRAPQSLRRPGRVTRRVRARALWLSLAALLLVLSATACGQAAAGGSKPKPPGPTPPPPPPPSSSAVFPLSVGGSGHLLLDKAGRPFWLQGDAAWSLIAQLTDSQIVTYLDDRAAKGFNAILVNAIEHKFADNAPNDINGTPPFTTPNDLSTPNEAYFSRLDTMIREADQRGILVMLFPAYLGAGGGDEGWYQVLEQSSAATIKQYGEYLGKRYASYPNILWMMGGDYVPPDTTVVTNLLAGIRTYDTAHLVSYHGVPETSAADSWSGAGWLDLNTTYSYSNTQYDLDLAQYARSPALPYILVESEYEQTGTGTPPLQTIRAQAYFTLLSGATGNVYGNNPVWYFGSKTGLNYNTTPWQDALDSPGAQDMSHLVRLVDGIPWSTLIPDTSGAFLVSGAGASGWTHALAAVSRDATLAIAYVPTQRTITLDLSQLAGSSASGYWFDPTSGSSTPIPSHALVRSDFTTPGTNSGGDQDWVLVLKSAP